MASRLALAVVMAYVSIIAHELGHYVAAVMYGLNAYIRLVMVGGLPLTAYTCIDLPSRHMASYVAVTSLAGPMVNLLLAAVLVPMAYQLDDVVMGVIGSVNAGICLTSTLPAFEMVNLSFRVLRLNDGGHAIYYSSAYPGMHVLCWSCIALMVFTSLLIMFRGIRYIVYGQ